MAGPRHCPCLATTSGMSSGQHAFKPAPIRGRQQHRHAERTQCRAAEQEPVPQQPEVGNAEAERSTSPSAAEPGRGASPSLPSNVVLPKTGYFSLADPNQEVYSRAGEAFDPRKKGGRFKPEFIWNTDWQKTMDMQESLQRKRDAAVEAQKRAGAPGAIVSKAGTGAVGMVGLSRLAELDRMDVDLTEVLLRKDPPKPVEPATSSVRKQRAGSPLGDGKTVPLPRNDVKRFERSARANRSMVTTVVSTKPEDEEAKMELAAQELARYEQEKMAQRAWVAAFSAMGAASTFAAYGREVCISYVVGALGGYVYLRLLGRSVDSFGEQSIAAGVTSSVGNQRLLIPIILALAYNRWNTLYADEYGVQLNLLAILVGFLTYKVALVMRQGKQYMDEISVRKE